MKVELCIDTGFAGAEHRDVVEIDDDELRDCKTEVQLEDLLWQYVEDFRNNMIDSYYRNPDGDTIDLDYVRTKLGDQ